MRPQSHVAPPSLRDSMARAESTGRVLVTSLDGRIAIILRATTADPIGGQADAVRRVVMALESAGIDVTQD